MNDAEGNIQEIKEPRPGEGGRSRKVAGFFDRLKKTARQVKSKTWPKIKKEARKYMTFGFLAMLLLSFIMWYVIKLKGTYTTEIPFNVDIAGNKIRVECVVTGKGDRLFAHRYYINRTIQLRLDEVETTQSPTDPEALVVSPYSLQNAISKKNSDIQIVSVGAIPEITYGGLQ